MDGGSPGRPRLVGGCFSSRSAGAQTLGRALATRGKYENRVSAGNGRGRVWCGSPSAILLRGQNVSCGRSLGNHLAPWFSTPECLRVAEEDV